MKAKLTDILFGQRKRTDYGDLTPLAESIKKYGQLQPIVVRIINNERFKYEIVAGGRRYKAHLLAGLSEIDVITLENCSDLYLRELELEENIRRKQLTWAEECQMQLELDDIKRFQMSQSLPGETKTWDTVDTAIALDQSVGKTYQDIQLARAMKADPKLAIELIKYPKGVAFKKLKQIEDRKKHERMFADGELKMSAHIEHGSCVDLINNLADNSVDLVITDPPFAVEEIDTAKDSYNDLSEKEDNSDAATMRTLYTSLFPKLFRVMNPGAHFYIFHAPEWYPFLVDNLNKCGFIVDPVPLIWNKLRTTTPFRGYAYQQMYEPILFGQKPPRDLKQLNAPSGNILSFSPIEQALKRHAYHKTPELIEFLINQSSHKGHLVLDPFAGSGQTLKSALKCHRSALGFELSKEHYLEILEYLKMEEKDGKNSDKKV